MEGEREVLRDLNGKLVQVRGEVRGGGGGGSDGVASIEGQRELVKDLHKQLVKVRTQLLLTQEMVSFFPSLPPSLPPSFPPSLC